MKYQIRVRSRARDDIRSARDWYDRQAAGLGARFGDEVDVVMTSIREEPLIHATIYHEVRRAMTRRFPYAIYYVVADDHVSVLRELHQARDPREWRGAAE